MSDPAVESPPQGLDTDTLRNALRVLRQRWWIVLSAVLLCALAAAALSLSRPDRFTSSAKVLFGQSQLADQTLGIQRDSGQPERFAATQVLVATSPDVATRARRSLKSSMSVQQLIDRVSVETSENADVLTFEATSRRPREAAEIANAFAAGYIDFNRDSELGQLRAQIGALQPQIEARAAGSPERQSLEERLAQLQTLLASADGGYQLIGRAEPSDERSSPQPRRDIVLGVLLGAVLGVALAFLLDILDRRVRSAEQFERIYRMRALASIPHSSFTARTHHDRVRGFEPYRILRNAIGYEELTRNLQAIMVTSAMPSEGKSSVAINLARTFALAGERVVLVECDLRRPSLTRHLGIENPGYGLTSALVAGRPVHELLQHVAEGGPNFYVLPSGPLPPNAAELLRSPRMAEMLAELKADDLRVILDAPPLLPIADAQGLLDHAEIDAALLVARAFQTTQDQARRTRAVLDQHRLQPLGLVVTGLKDEAGYGYYGVDPAGAAAVSESAAVGERPGAVRR